MTGKTKFTSEHLLPLIKKFNTRISKSIASDYTIETEDFILRIWECLQSCKNETWKKYECTLRFKKIDSSGGFSKHDFDDETAKTLFKEAELQYNNLVYAELNRILQGN